MPKTKTSTPEQHMTGHFFNGILEYTLVDESWSMMTKSSQQFVLNGRIDKTFSLIQAIVWRQTGKRPSAESMMTQLTDAYMCHHGPLTKYVKLRIAHAPGMPRTFSRPWFQRKPLISDPGMHPGTCVIKWYVCILLNSLISDYIDFC